MDKSPEQKYTEELQKFDEAMSPLIRNASEEVRKKILRSITESITEGTLHNESTRSELLAFAQKTLSEATLEKVSVQIED